MRVGIAAIMHESNTFIRDATTLEHFHQDLFLRGDDVRRLESSHHEVGGFFAGLMEPDVEIVPLLATRAVPYGVVSDAAFRALRAALHERLDHAGPLHGLLVAPHGAMVSESEPDADGCWLAELRQRVGPGVPIIGTLDLHANLSPRMVDAADALIAYRTNPHLDQRARGIEAAKLLVRTLRGEVRPTQAGAFPPVVINIERQHTGSSPCRELFSTLDEQRRRPQVLSNSCLLGFPYADVPEIGAAVVSVTDGDPGLARQCANELAEYIVSRREDFVGRLIDVEIAIEQALASPAPACLLDMGDNVGGGSPGDGTVLLHALNSARVEQSFVCLYDPDSVAQAERAGPGARTILRLGGKSDDRHGMPLESACRVISLHDGRFEETEPRHGGMMRFDQGRTAVVETETGVTVMLTSRRMPPFSLQQLISCGLAPEAFRILVAKGVHAPVAAYGPVCAAMIRVNTPGVTTADLSQLTFRSRRRPLFPWESIAPTGKCS